MNKKNIYIRTTNWIGKFVFLTFLLPAITFTDQGYDLDEFDDLELESVDRQNKKNAKLTNDGQRLILFDDNLYLLDDDFDFGVDELELQKLELNPDDMETAKEYENFLNVFFENSIPVGNNQYRGQNQSGDRKESFKSSSRSQSQRNSADRQNTNRPTSQTRQNTNRPTSQTSIGKLGFGVSTMFGTTIPIGTNLKQNFSSGSNFGIHLDTPLSFNLGSMEAKVGTEVYFSSMSAVDAGGSPYKLTNLVGTISLFPMKSLEVKAGLGLSPSTIGDFSKVLFSIPVDINYHLPFNVGGFGMALNLHAQETLGIPNDQGTEDTKATSEFINVGLFVTTPLVF